MVWVCACRGERGARRRARGRVSPGAGCFLPGTTLQAGQAVALVGLKARPELNTSRGVVLPKDHWRNGRVVSVLIVFAPTTVPHDTRLGPSRALARAVWVSCGMPCCMLRAGAAARG